MRKVFALVLALTTLQGCASRSLYAPASEHGGYSQRQESGMQVARFSGNARTDSTDASLFSQLRALEICKEQGYGFTKIVGTKNLTSSRVVRHTEISDSYSPLYSHEAINVPAGSPDDLDEAMPDRTVLHVLPGSLNFAGVQFGGDHYGDETTWVEVQKFPTFDTFFTCSSQSAQNTSGAQGALAAQATQTAQATQDYASVVEKILGATCQHSEISKRSICNGAMRVPASD